MDNPNSGKSPASDSWWLEAALATFLVIPGFVAGCGWEWVIGSWLISVIGFSGLLRAFGRGSAVHSFLATAIVALLVALLYRQT